MPRSKAKRRTPRSKVRSTTEARIRWLDGRIRVMLLDMEDARSTSPTAVAQLHKEVRTYRKERDALKMQLAREDDLVAADTAEELSPEEWLEKNRLDAQQASDEALDLYFHEWLQRHRLRYLLEDGEPRLVRQAS